MGEKFTDEELTRYVLGELAEPEQARLEEGFFEDDALYERVCAIEEEVAEGYVRGELEPETRRRIEEGLRHSERLRERAVFVRSLVAALDEPGAAVAPERAVVSMSTWYDRLLDTLRVHRVGFAMAAIAVILAVLGGLWFARDDTRPSLPPPDITSTPPDRPPDEPDVPTVPQPQPSPQPDPEPVRPALATFVLTPGVSRSGETPAQLRVPAGVRSVRLRLPLEEPVAGDLGALLRSASGRVVWRAGSLRARQNGGGAIVEVTVPAKLLANGSYILSLDRDAGAGDRETVEAYSFAVRNLPIDRSGEGPK